MEMGSVRKILDSHFPEGIPESAASPIIRDILLGLVHLHERGIVHRALKVNNKYYLSRIRNKRSTTLGKTGLTHDIFFNSHLGLSRSLRSNENRG